VHLHAGRTRLGPLILISKHGFLDDLGSGIALDPSTRPPSHSRVRGGGSVASLGEIDGVHAVTAGDVNEILRGLIRPAPALLSGRPSLIRDPEAAL
jgi:hypothetical protein